MAAAAILTEHCDGGVVVLELNRPQQRNALDREMLAALRAAFAAVEADSEARAVVLTGAGRSFCSGAHHSVLLEQAQLSVAERRAGIRWVYDTLLAPRRSRLPVVTAINGHAIAAGAVLALAGDMVVAAEAAKVGLGFVKLGLYPAVGLTWWLPRLVGRQRAFEILALGEVMTAEQARQAGLVGTVVPAASLREEAVGLATRLAAGPPMALARIKEAMIAGEGSTLAAALVLDVEHQSACAASADLQEGLRAFLEKRPPRFRGC